MWTGSAGAGTTATRVLGQPDFTHNATTTLSAGSLNFPGNHGSGAVVVDVINDHVYVADTGNNRVLGWASLSALTTGKFPDIVIGQLDFESSVAGTSSTRLSSPNGVAVDAAGNVYVADTGNSHVLEFPNPFTSFNNDGQFSNFAASVVLGQVGNFTSGSRDVDTGSPDSETLCSPQGVAVDGDNNVWVTDTGNNRVVEYSGPVTADSFYADLVFGQLGSFSSKTANNGGISKNSLNQPNGGRRPRKSLRGRFEQQPRAGIQHAALGDSRHWKRRHDGRRGMGPSRQLHHLVMRQRVCEHAISPDQGRRGPLR